MRQVSSTQCRVTILSPTGRTFVLGSLPRGTRRQSHPDWQGGLLAVETEKDLHEPVGGFTLTLDALADTEGRTWDERIPMHSLVRIEMQRPDLPTPTGTTVMLGLTDSHTLQESFGEAQPRRLVQIQGRELSCVIVDAHLLFHPFLAANPAYGTLTVASQLRGTFEPMALTANPLLVTPGEPRFILRMLLNWFLFQGGTPTPPGLVAGAIGDKPAPAVPATPAGGMPVPQHPLISLHLPGLRLAEALVLNDEVWQTFEEPVSVPIAQFPARAGSLWNYLHLFIDRNFQEFFTRVEDGVCKIHFRGKPFLHTEVLSGTRFKSATDTNGTLQTLQLDPADILTRVLQRESTSVYNYFLVLPYGFADSYTTANYRHVTLPQVVIDPAHPSFVGRYGIRVLEVHSRYLAPFQPGPASAPEGAVRTLKPPSQWEPKYAPLANQLAAEEGLPAHLRPWFVATIKQESGFDPTITSYDNGQGIAQWTPPFPTDVGLVNPYDPENALRAAARYWNKLRADPWIGDDPRLITAAYNAGSTAVRQHKGIPPGAQKHVRLVESYVHQYEGLAGFTTPAPGQVAGPIGGVAPPAPRKATQAEEDTMIATGVRWGAILKHWYDMGGELFGGVFTVRGDPRWNVGHRVLSRDHRGPWEAYLEGVRHRYDVRTGQYLTTLRVSRGWYLSASVAQQIREEGALPGLSVAGGPPAVAATPPPADDPRWRLRLEVVPPPSEKE